MIQIHSLALPSTSFCENQARRFSLIPAESQTNQQTSPENITSLAEATVFTGSTAASELEHNSRSYNFGVTS